jgi:hypothetical protein
MEFGIRTEPYNATYRIAEVSSIGIRRPSHAFKSRFPPSTEISSISDSRSHDALRTENSRGMQSNLSDEHSVNADFPMLDILEAPSNVRTERFEQDEKQ